MLLKNIVARLDAELERLEALRGIIAGLAQSRLPDLPLVSPSEREDMRTHTVTEIPGEAPPLLPTILAPVKPRVPRAVHRKPSAEKRALQSAIPSTPVVVSAATLAREREMRPAAPAPRKPEPVRVAKPADEGPSLGALIRAMETRSAKPNL